MVTKRLKSIIIVRQVIHTRLKCKSTGVKRPQPMIRFPIAQSMLSQQCRYALCGYNWKWFDSSLDINGRSVIYWSRNTVRKNDNGRFTDHFA